MLPVPPRPDDYTARDDGTATVPVSAEEEGDLRAVVGPNARFYLASWRNAATSRDAGMGFNRAAFFLSYVWLGYRRMYRRALVLYAILLAELVAEEVVFCGLLGWLDPPALLTPVVGFTVAVVCGVQANRWYLGHARRVIAEERDANAPEPAADREALAARGGTDFPGALAVVFLCFISMLGVGAVKMALHIIFTGQ